MKRYDYVALLKGFKKIGIKQELIASEVGVAQATISRWVNKEAEPSIDNYFAIVDLAKHHGLITEEDGGATLMRLTYSRDWEAEASR